MLKIAEYRNVLNEDGSIKREKIKLKVLEEFGFKYNKQIKCYEMSGRTAYLDDIATYYITKNREVQINTYNGDYVIDDIIYDLIQAGLVEKV